MQKRKVTPMMPDNSFITPMMVNENHVTPMLADDGIYERLESLFKPRFLGFDINFYGQNKDSSKHEKS